MDEQLMVPKHRFDCINLALKETKQALHKANEDAEKRVQKLERLEAALLNAVVECALALNGAKSIVAVKALLDMSQIRLEQDGNVSGIEEQIALIKKDQSYLFGSAENIAYVLVPIESGDPLNKSINNYIKKSRRTEK